jgi:outer membrane protein assembly factor BamB
VLWARGLPNSVIETPTVDGAGVLTVGTWDKTSTPNAAYVLDANTGKILRTLNVGGRSFAPSVFADGWLLTTNVTGGMRGYHLRTNP